MKKTNFTFFRKQAINILFLGCLFTLATAHSAYSQCSLACNGTTNVSLDNANCEATITVGMVADVSGCVGGNFKVVVDDAQGDPIPDAKITADYVGQTLVVHVVDMNTGNSCWGYLVIEDKLKPTIVCPDPSTIVYCYSIESYLPTATDNCDSDPEIIMTNEVVTINDCNSGLDPSIIKVIERTFIAEDDQGLQSVPCTVEFAVYRIPQLSDIDEPDNYLLINSTALQCDGDFPLDPYGRPSPIDIDSLEGTGVPSLDGVDLFPNPYSSVCNLLVTYQDTELPPIGCAIKIMRTWKLIEWSCSNPQRTYEFIQMIEIVDSQGPEIVCPADFTVSTNTHACEATVLMPSAYVMDNCSDDIDVDIAYPGGFIDNSNGGLAQLPVGVNVVTYTAYDECLNSNSCQILVTVKDLTPPVVICDQNTTVALTSDGYAWVNASVFDDGTYDECELASLTVKRMDDGVPCDNVDDDIFDSYVRFCCLDQGADVMVILRATDAAGNVNDCMVSVEVQDKLAPTIICPGDLTVNCDFAYEEDNLAEYFGEAIIMDNCADPNPQDILIGSLNQCNIGTLIRQISVGEEGTANYAVCTQEITFESLDLFNDGVPDNYPDTDIYWPNDVTMTGCLDPSDSQFLPSNLPVGAQFPTYDEGACDLVGANYDDQVFPFNNPNGDACFKIVRTWTVIDWCQFVTVGGATTYPQWTHVQIIKINDTEGPTITSSCAKVSTCTYDAQCLDGFISLGATATDNCTALLKWSYKVDLNNDGYYNSGYANNGVGNSINASGVYPIGSHSILYTFEDKCGNVISCSQEFDVVNCKAPTPYCLNGLAVDLMPIDEDNDGEIDGGEVVLWATDFDAGSSHPCGYKVYISFDPVFFSQTGNTTLPNGKKIQVNNGKLFDCSTLGNQSVNIYAAVVTPQDSVIQAYCTTFVDVQDNMEACTSLKAGIAGGITTTMDTKLKNAEVELIGSELAKSMTDADGHYAFPLMPLGGTYKVSPVKNDDYTNGVSTLDLVMIQRHILGIELFNTPYKVIAADINHDEMIAASDLLQLRKLILGTIVAFPENGSWRFIDAGFVFPDSEDPFASPIPESYDISTLNSDMVIDFVGVKVGDINGNAVANLSQSNTSTRSQRSVELSADNQEFDANQHLIVPVTINEGMKLTGMQFTIELGSSLEFVGIQSAYLDINDYNIGFSQLANGIITVSWNHPEGVQIHSDEILFNLEVESISAGTMAKELNISSTKLEAEMYNDLMEVYAINYSMDGRDSGNSEAFVLNQNTPNPFGSRTQITFELPTSEKGVLTVFDVTGKIVAQVSRKFEKGFNQITLEKAQLGAAGVLYYQLEAGKFLAAKKMIMID